MYHYPPSFGYAVRSHLRVAPAFWPTSLEIVKITSVYVDAFNLYYRALRGTPYKWLDISALFPILLSGHEVRRIKYFTAKVSARPDDPGQPIRQQTYFRALKTLPTLSFHYGHFLTHKIWLPLADPPENGERYVRVLKTEEKGSDVNLATHLLADGFRDEYEAAVVISNDSDLLEPIRIAKEELGKIVGVLHPARHPTHVLVRQASFFKGIRPSALARSQFPESITDSRGTFHKPIAW